MVTERQELILRSIVEGYLETGKPVGSKAIAGEPGVEWGSSTVRSELAALEDAGFLTHPHTSAGRVPTDAGYRWYVDALLESGSLPATTGVGLEVSRLRQEVDEAMRETTTALAQVTDLMAMVTAPPLESATIHRVEALRLQPNIVMVIVISSAGAVTKRIFTFEATVDPGLVEWASSYLNESLTGLGVGARMIAGHLADPHLDPVEASFLPASPPPLPSSSARRARRYMSRERLICSPRTASPIFPKPTRSSRPSKAGRVFCGFSARRSSSARCFSGSVTRTRSPSCAP